MVTELLALIAYLVENCTGVVLSEASESHSLLSCDSQANLEQQLELSNSLEDFTAFDPQDTIFEEFDPPNSLQSDPKAWKLDLWSFSKSFWECLKSALLIQTVAGSLVGIVAVVIIFLELSTVTWCYDGDSNSLWYKMPNNVQHLKITANNVIGFPIQLWDFVWLCTIFPFSLLKQLNLLTVSLIGAFTDVVYRLNFQMFGIYKVPWMRYPLNAMFCLVIIINHMTVARNFYPQSLQKTFKLHFIITAQYYLGIPVMYFLVYKLFNLYVEQKEQVQVVTAALCPLLTVLPKVVSRLAAQDLKGIVHPGTAHVFASVFYGMSALVFRVMQAELTSIGLFIALGIAHAIVDLLERITITMRDHIWEYLYRLVRRQRSRQPKYRSPRSRRFIADLSIQIMMQESSSLIYALGFISVYQSLYSNSKPFLNYESITDFLVRVGIGLSIDLVFNTISLLIQTRVMNVAVNRVWKKKWRHHIVANCLVVWMSAMYLSHHLFVVVRNKYDSGQHLNINNTSNCSFPSFL